MILEDGCLTVHGIAKELGINPVHVMPQNFNRKTERALHFTKIHATFVISDD